MARRVGALERENIAPEDQDILHERTAISREGELAKQELGALQEEDPMMPDLLSCSSQRLFCALISIPRSIFCSIYHLMGDGYSKNRYGECGERDTRMFLLVNDGTTP